MAEEEPWNKVNIPFPGAVSFARIPVGQTTGLLVNNVLGGINKVLIVLESEILQTEIRLLYELLYILNNNLGRNKTIRVLKQVEQCINRLKMMKLDVALHDLMDLCPRTKINRLMGMESVERDVPSQPMLEWICLKVLGAAQLMSCVLKHCSRAFVLSQQHVNSRDFVIVNVVINSMLSRLWVFFRGLLAQLAPLYQLILTLLREVAQVRPMPYLTHFSLPADMAQFLGPSDASLLTIKAPGAKAAPRRAPPDDGRKRLERRSAMMKMTSSKKKAVKDKAAKKKAVMKKSLKKAVKKKDRRTKEERRQWGEELGLVVERDKFSTIVDMKSLLNTFGNFTKASKIEIDQKKRFKNRVKAATSFADMATHLEEMIPWCKSQNLQQEKRCLTFLRLKCQKMKCLESAGYNVQRKLRSFKQEACWASSPKGSVPRTCLSVSALWRSARHRTRFQPPGAQRRPTTAGVCVKRKRPQRLKKRTELSAHEEEQGADEAGSSTSRTPEFTLQTSACASEDEIDDIFASVAF